MYRSLTDDIYIYVQLNGESPEDTAQPHLRIQTKPSQEKFHFLESLLPFLLERESRLTSRQEEALRGISGNRSLSISVCAPDNETESKLADTSGNTDRIYFLMDLSSPHSLPRKKKVITTLLVSMIISVSRKWSHVKKTVFNVNLPLFVWWYSWYKSRIKN